MKHGVYKIENICDKSLYIGSGNLKERFYHNFNDLKRNAHYNSNFQESYNLYGKENFEFIVLLYCESFELIRYEQFLVDKYKNSGLLYNVCIYDVQNRKKVKATQKTRAKMCKSHPDMRGKNNPMWGKKGKNSPLYRRYNGKSNPFYGKTHTSETIEKMSGENNHGIIKETIVRQVIDLLEKKVLQKDIVKKTGISLSTIAKVKQGFYNDIYNLPTKKYIRGNTKDKEIVLEILQLLNKGMIQSDIAKKLNVGIGTVYKVKSGGYNKTYNLENNEKNNK